MMVKEDDHGEIKSRGVVADMGEVCSLNVINGTRRNSKNTRELFGTVEPDKIERGKQDCALWCL